jgi:membrane protein DedA with SNARE-associated domain
LILQELEHLVATYGYLGVLVSITLESFGVPLPAESLLIVASWVAAKGQLNIVIVVAVAWFAAVLGDNIGYLIGRLVGHRVIERFGPYVGATPPLVEKFRGLFFRYGPAIIIIARLIEVLRQMNGILAGSMGMPWWRFVVCNMIGAAIWVAIWGYGAYLFGEHMDQIILLVERHKTVSLVLAAAVGLSLLIAGFLYARRLHRQ